MQIDSRISVSILALLIGFYAWFSVPDVFSFYDYFDSMLVDKRVDSLTITNSDVYLRYYLLSVGYELGVPKIIPFLESIGLLIMTYLVTVQISKRRISGLVSVIIVSTSNLFLFYDTSVAYDNSWVLFLLLGVYFSKRWVGTVSFLASIFCKQMTAVFVPSMIFLQLKNKKLGLAYIITGVIGIYLAFDLYDSFKPDEFAKGLTDSFYWLQSDLYMIVMVPIVMFFLFYFRKKYDNTMIPFVFMANSIVSGGIVEGFTPMLNEAYRYIPLVVFFAIGDRKSVV